MGAYFTDPTTYFQNGMGAKCVNNLYPPGRLSFRIPLSEDAKETDDPVQYFDCSKMTFDQAIDYITTNYENSGIEFNDGLKISPDFNERFCWSFGCGVADPKAEYTFGVDGTDTNYNSDGIYFNGASV